MREARVGFGALALPAPRRALVLPQRAAIEGGGAPWPVARAPRPGDVLLDPDPAIVLAGLVGEAAREVDARPVHPRIAYLVGPRAAPWARCVRVREVLPASPRAVEERLAELDVGELEVRSRGVDETAAAWRRRLRLVGSGRATVVRTRGPDDRYLVVLGEPLGCGTPGPTGVGGRISRGAAGMP
jgi:hypothetical protein